MEKDSIFYTEFVFLTDEDIDRLADFKLNDVPQMNSNHIKFGASALNCGTCNKKDCMGHRASLDFGCAIFHPKFETEILNAFNNTCLFCGNEKPKFGENRKKCVTQDCKGVFYGDYTIQKKKKLGIIAHHNYSKDFYTPQNVKDILIKGNRIEHRYIIRKMLIPVLQIRSTTNTEWVPQFARYIQNIIDLVLISTNEKNRNVQLDIYSVYTKLINLIFSDMLSKKEGLPRQALIGKTQNKAGRFVVTPNPYLQIDEIEIPYTFSRHLLLNEIVNKYNINYILKNIQEYTYKNTYEPINKEDVIIGTELSRYLRNGDMIFVNRPPTLTKISILALKIKIKKNKLDGTISIHLSLTGPFKGDFDGDELSLFLPQNLDAIAEAIILCSVDAILLDSTNHSLFEPPHSMAITLYQLSKENKIINKRDMMQFQWSFETSICNLNTTYDLISLLFPNTLNVSNEDFEIKNGYLIRGPIKSFYRIYKYLSSSQIKDILYKLGLLSIEINRIFPLTLHFKDCILNKNHKSEFERIKINQNIDILYWIDKTMNNDYRNSPILTVVNSGAKGSMMNILQILGDIGKQYIGNEAIKDLYIDSNFMDGLNADHFFEHMKTANRSIAVSSMETSGPGHLSRLVSYIVDIDVEIGFTHILGDKYHYIRFYPKNEI